MPWFVLLQRTWRSRAVSGGLPRNMEKRPHLKGRPYEKTGPCLRHGPVMLYGCAGDSTGKRAGAIFFGMIEYL